MAEEQVKTITDELKGYLAKLPGAPADATIESWKETFGQVFIFGFSEKEIVIFRPILRGEYVSLMEKAGEQSLSQGAFNQLLLDTVVLFPAKTDWQESKAGTVDTLTEQVMLRSNFLSPQAASMLIGQL